MTAIVEIDRISLRVPGVERDAGARLARLVADRLVPALALVAGGDIAAAATPRAREPPGDGAPEALAGRVAASDGSLLIGEALEAGR